MYKITKIFAFVFVLIFLASGIKAVSSDLGDSYKQKETVIMKIEGNILQQIQASQVKLKRGNSFVAFEYGLKNINDKNYLWMITPSIEGIYKIIIEDIEVIENGESKLVDYEKDFNISNERADYYAKPGAIISLYDFYVYVVNNKEFDIPININLPDSREVILKPGENKIKFSVKDFVGTQTVEINIGSYKVPAKIYGTKNESAGTTDENETITEPTNFTDEINQNYTGIFKFSSGVIRGIISNSSAGEKIIFQIENTGTERIEDLRFIYNEDFFLIEPESQLILPNEKVIFNLTIKKIPETNFRDAVLAKGGNYSDYMLVILEISENNQNVSVEYIDEDDESSFYYCSEISGKICTGDESCTETEVDSLDGKCCVGECVKESGRGYGWIGYLIAVILVLVVGFVFFKYRKIGMNKESAIKEKFLSAEKKIP